MGKSAAALSTVLGKSKINLAIILSLIAILISGATFAVQYVPSQNLSYEVVKLQNNSLPLLKNVVNQSYVDIAFDLLLIIINQGNRLALVNTVDLYVKDYVKYVNPDNQDCARNDQDSFKDLYLYEHQVYDERDFRGTSMTGDFGRKTIPAFSVAPRNSVQDEHRFSLFDQQDPTHVYIPSISGLLCLDVFVTTSEGHTHHTTELLAKLTGVLPGQRLSSVNFQRINRSKFSVDLSDFSNEKNIDGLEVDIIKRPLVRNWPSYVLP